jgi:Tfp pilus assembly protein PilX
MKAFINIIGKERGSAIVITMIILALLTIIGISATNISTNELKVADSDKNYKIAFYHAEGGIYAISKWVSQVVDDYAVPTQGVGNDFKYLDDTDDLLDEAMGYSLDDADEISFAMPTYHNGDSTVNVNFTRSRTVVMAGGGAASLGEGTSSTGTGPTLGLPYWVIGTVTTPTNTSAEIAGRYLKVDGITGGL